MLNYKETVDFIYMDEELSFRFHTDPCITVLNQNFVILVIDP